VKRLVRWSVALGSGLILGLTALTPVATASAAASAPAASSTRTLVEIPAKAAIEGAVEPSECDEDTLLNDFVLQTLLSMTPEQLAFTFQHVEALTSVPTYDALFFGTAGDPDYALESHARQLTNTFRDLRRFWSDVQSDDIQLLAMHGDVLLDEERIAATLTLMDKYELLEEDWTPEEIALEAKTIAAFMESQGSFFDNPIWTLNAFAFSGEGEPEPEIAALPDKLVFGDGLLVAYDSFGLGDVGPRVIMAHEFAHHVQFELGVFEADPENPAEATRRTELMADAMAAYYGVHKKGLALNSKRVVDTLVSFYIVGDCSFDSEGHHGTPIQRQRAAEWGAALAKAAKPASFVLSAEDVVEMFDAALPGIISG